MGQGNRAASRSGEARLIRCTLLAAVLVFATAAPAAPLAAPPASTESTPCRERGHCFRGQPYPCCRHFWITEFGFAYRFDTRARGDREDVFFAWELGHMVNVSARDAVGLTVEAATANRIVLYARYRRWIAPPWSVDIAPGIAVSGDQDGGLETYPYPALHLVLNRGDVISFSGRAEWITSDLEGMDVAVRAGLGLGSVPGTAVGIAFPVAIILALVLTGYES